MKASVARSGFRLQCVSTIASTLIVLLSVGVKSQDAKRSQAPLQKGPIPVPKEVSLPQALPFSFWNGLIVLGGRVNAAGNEQCLLATGLNACVISPAAYERYKLAALPKPIRVDVFDTVLEATETQAASLQLNQLTLENLRLAKLDVFSTLSRSIPPDAPTIWLGSPFLSAFQVTLDFSSRILLLNAPKAPLPKAPGTIVVPLTLRDGRLWVKASTPGAPPFLALVDTGTNGTLIPGDVGTHLSAKPLRTFTIAHTNGSQAKANLVILPQLSVGQAEVQNMRAVFLAADAPAGFDRTLAVLGTDFLSHFKVTINYARKQLALSPLLPPGTSSDNALTPQ